MLKNTISKNLSLIKQIVRKSSRTENFRVEYDTFGPVNVPSEKLWAAQTQRKKGR